VYGGSLSFDIIEESIQLGGGVLFTFFQTFFFFVSRVLFAFGSYSIIKNKVIGSTYLCIEPFWVMT